ncbi:unnamed protein product [Orchesella dallaii]|uniref:non-specific serine/threonine protein kinase n=1 Tax=Orchesella dallaii TaxID=48710 RepID=A0ABP1PNA0_9HEXA
MESTEALVNSQVVAGTCNAFTLSSLLPSDWKPGPAEDSVGSEHLLCFREEAVCTSVVHSWLAPAAASATAGLLTVGALTNSHHDHPSSNPYYESTTSASSSFSFSIPSVADTVSGSAPASFSPGTSIWQGRGQGGSSPVSFSSLTLTQSSGRSPLDFLLENLDPYSFPFVSLSNVTLRICEKLQPDWLSVFFLVVLVVLLRIFVVKYKVSVEGRRLYSPNLDKKKTKSRASWWMALPPNRSELFCGLQNLTDASLCFWRRRPRVEKSDGAVITMRGSEHRERGFFCSDICKERRDSSSSQEASATSKESIVVEAPQGRFRKSWLVIQAFLRGLKWSSKSQVRSRRTPAVVDKEVRAHPSDRCFEETQSPVVVVVQQHHHRLEEQRSSGTSEGETFDDIQSYNDDEHSLSSLIQLNRQKGGGDDDGKTCDNPETLTVSQSSVRKELATETGQEEEEKEVGPLVYYNSCCVPSDNLTVCESPTLTNQLCQSPTPVNSFVSVNDGCDSCHTLCSSDKKCVGSNSSSSTSILKFCGFVTDAEQGNTKKVKVDESCSSSEQELSPSSAPCTVEQSNDNVVCTSFSSLSLAHTPQCTLPTSTNPNHNKVPCNNGSKDCVGLVTEFTFVLRPTSSTTCVTDDKPPRIFIDKTSLVEMRGPSESSGELAPALFQVGSNSGSSKDFGTTTTCDEAVTSLSDSGLATQLCLSDPRTSSNTSEGSDDDEEILGSDDDEQEDPRDYCKGGYHPVKIGDLFHNRYHVVRKLGWGHFSTVWLCWDLVGRRYVALKVVKSAPHYTDTALDEIKLLKCVRDSDPTDPNREKTVQLLDDFKITGVNGTHVCMVFEVLGNNLLKLIIRSNYHGIPLQNVKSIMRQTLEALEYLHAKCKIIHTDIKPENILLCVDDQHVRQLANEATNWQKLGVKLPGSAVSTAPKEFQGGANSKMSKNKKKKMKKKAKKQAQLLEQQLQQLQEVEEHETPGQDGECEENPTTNQDSMDSFAGKGSQRDVKTEENEIDSEDSEGGAAEHSDSNEAPNKSGNVMSIPKKHSNVENRKSFSELAEANVISGAHMNGHESQMHQSKSTGERELVDMVDDGHASTSSTMRRTTSCPDQKVAGRPDPVKEVCDINIKIADLGNACWVDHHFTEDIQTRQYRCLEVLLGAGYGPPADIWSTACMVKS